jgi:predicted O-methyltransferase YrrM
MSFVVQLRGLPPSVAMFQWRARRLALRSGDSFALVSGTRPRNLAVLLGLARGCRRVVELGTGSAWTAISLALADGDRVVVSYDPIERQERERYVLLVGRKARERLRLIGLPGDQAPPNETVDLLYIDSSHDLDDTLREVDAWRPALHPGSLIVFDDYGHPSYPGVEEAVAQMGLSGDRRGALFVHRVAGATGVGR